jgi:hypothetical protein
MYFITCFLLDSNEKHWPVKSSRCFGYYEDLETAETAVKGNWCDIHEYTYEYALIEKIEPGIHSIANERKCYKWNDNIECYLPCDEPKEIKGVCNFAIG